MEVRPGYKQTEVGVIPGDWDCVTLDSIGIFSKGQGIRKDEALTGDIPCVRYGELYTRHNNVVREFHSQISAEVAKTSRLIKKGDLLFAGSGETKEEIGRCAAVIHDFAVYAGSDIVIFSPKKGDSTFLGYLANAPQIARQKASLGQGDAVVHISASSLSSIKIGLPPAFEQRAIATALSDMDALLAKFDQIIAKKRDLKQAAMQQLLTGQTRLPGFSGEWEVKRLGDVAHIKTGAKNNDDKVEDGEYPLFVRSQTIERISTYSYDYEAILVPGEGGIGSIFHYINGKFDCHQRVYKISAFNADTCGKFIFFCMKHLFHKQATRNSVKATVDSLRLPTFLEFEFVAPAREEQEAIVTVLSDMDAELAALEARRDKTRALKQGMMQELLSGRIRLV